MKKIVGLIIVSFALLSTACDKGIKNHFKEYTFYGITTQAQGNEIANGLAENALNLVSKTTTAESYAKSDLVEEKQSSKTTVKLYDDPQNPNLFMVQTSGSNKRDYSSQGITVSYESKAEAREWDAGNGYVFSFSETTTNKNKEENISATENDPSNSENYKNTRIKQYVSIPSSSTFYLNKDGSYTVIYSSVEKTVSAVEWGGGTKEYHVERKEQQVYSISKDYRLTTFSYYTEYKTNRDPNTGAWYKKEQKVSSSYQQIDYKYGDREKKDVASFNNLIANKQIILSALVFSKDATATENNADYIITDDDALNTSTTPTLVSTEDGLRTYRLTGSISGYYYSSNYSALKFELSVTFLDGAQGVKTYNYPLGLAQNYNNRSSSYFEVVQQNGKVYLINKNYYSESFLIEFTYNGREALIQYISIY